MRTALSGAPPVADARTPSPPGGGVRCALLLAAVVALGGCASGAGHDTSGAPAASRTAVPLSAALARFRHSSSRHADAASSPDAFAPSEPTTDAARAAFAATRAAAPAAPSSPRPRPLDPVPPLYVPPSRAPALQPILDTAPAAKPEAFPRAPSRSPALGPRDTDDPLRRIDPLTGRDALGRPDPGGGIDLGDLLAR